MYDVKNSQIHVMARFKIIAKLHLQAFWQNFENGKLPKFGLCFQDLKNSSQKLLNRILRYCTQIVLRHVLSGK